MNLIYVKQLGKNYMDIFEYEFFFSDKKEEAWNDLWDEDNPSAFEEEDLEPNQAYVTKIERLKSIIPLKCIQNNQCFPFKHSIDGLISLAWEDISEYEEYPEPIRLTFDYGESIESVKSKLGRRSQFFYGEDTEKEEEF